MAAAFMELALEQAKFALDNLEVPVGCVIVEDGKVISSGSNKTNATRNATRHAEMEAIDVLLREWQSMGLDQPQPQGLTDQYECLNNDWFVYLDYNHNAKTSGVRSADIQT
ncbi:unnamed protein product [Miscanthus lutarioriparius]|uniref:CMP/dCMP-type deaminase domain-containing protein n=1 Tax=Miscanthus lutarioriparius TaxID=422564 RepID=A0A811MN96_9POAL|nr:unnamed protein product [Miscanthus lutarioriparius]